jgi:hypothetical protein
MSFETTIKDICGMISQPEVAGYLALLVTSILSMGSTITCLSAGLFPGPNQAILIVSAVALSVICAASFIGTGIMYDKAFDRQ